MIPHHPHNITLLWSDAGIPFHPLSLVVWGFLHIWALTHHPIGLNEEAWVAAPISSSSGTPFSSSLSVFQWNGWWFLQLILCVGGCYCCFHGTRVCLLCVLPPFRWKQDLRVRRRRGLNNIGKPWHFSLYCIMGFMSWDLLSFREHGDLMCLLHIGFLVDHPWDVTVLIVLMNGMHIYVQFFVDN